MIVTEARICTNVFFSEGTFLMSVKTEVCVGGGGGGGPAGRGQK